MAASICAALGAADAAAGWGAIAVSGQTNDPAWGYAHGFRSAEAAKRRALSECEKRAKDGSCDVKLSFDGCGAVGFLEITTKMPDGRTGIVKQLNRGLGQTANSAARSLTEGCERGGRNLLEFGEMKCNTLAVVCSDRGLATRADPKDR